MLKARAAWRAFQKREQEKRKRQEEARNRRIGRIVLQMVEDGAYPRDEFMADLDRFLSDPRDRKLFGLPPRETESAAAVEQLPKRRRRMTRKQLIDRVVESSEASLSKRDAGEVLDAVFGTMGRAVCESGRFVWPGFGTFTVRERAARQGRSPRTGEWIQVKASRTVGFRPAPALKDRLGKEEVLRGRTGTPPGQGDSLGAGAQRDVTGLRVAQRVHEGSPRIV